MATHEVKPSALPAQARAPLIITSAEISRYAEISVLVSQLEEQQKALRAELLGLHKAGAKKESDSPFLLAFVEQERHTVNWKSEVLSLAAEVYGAENVTTWKLQTEQAAPVPTITQIRVKPNRPFAVGLRRPAAPVPTASPTIYREVVARFGD